MLTKEELDIQYSKVTKNEVAFLKENDLMDDNPTSRIFSRDNGKIWIDLPLILTSYKQYLIDNEILKEIECL